ncbi:MAG TPA: hypothetical protein DEH25_13185 [Chloroflexi bacterium]|nr:hypothetical protein [Chloroflexota bacterium]
MKRYGRSTVSEFLGDSIAYRGLKPIDTRLPGVTELRASLRMPGQGVPRKTAPEYAQLVSQLLRRARALDVPNAEINSLIFIGDTRLNDATAFSNICAAGDWPGVAFICAEKPDEPTYHEILPVEANRLVVYANRWELLRNFNAQLAEHAINIDEHTAIILDLDKTCIGARGRNDQVIDQARVDAAFTTVRALVGDDFNATAFQKAYTLLNQPEFHPFTTDNQDYLVYLCLMISAGLYAQDQLVEEIRAGRLFRFDQLLSEVERQAAQLPAGVREIHRDVYARTRAGDPTPFKAFRANEYREMVARLGQMDAESPVVNLLAQEIVITQEVRECALDWRLRGALLFGLSDKPDEASIPSAALASQGFLPIHRMETDVVGV